MATDRRKPELKLTTNDPLLILASTKQVLDGARDVHIDSEKLDILTKTLDVELSAGLGRTEGAGQGVIGITDNYGRDIQLIFIENVVNFCFWAEKGHQKWETSWRGKTRGGWYGLALCFERALAADNSILDANYLARLNQDEAEMLFKSSNGTVIPLTEKRIDNLREAGRILLREYDGQFINVVIQAEFDAIRLVEILARSFPSFRDNYMVDGKPVRFLKRAQIAAFDLSLLRHGPRRLTRVDSLAAFADYKLPQVLREHGAIVYSDHLVNLVDTMSLLPSGSREGVEIRAATVWSVELVRQQLNGRYTAAQIDNALWFLSQKLSDDAKPYHRTYSIYY